MESKETVAETAEQVQTSARRVAEEGKNVRDEVRELTIQALTQGRLDTERTKSVVKAVMEGVSQGVGSNGKEIKAKLEQAWMGVDEALEKSAEAMNLTVKEAKGRVGDFTQSELKQAVSEFSTLEDMFLETVTKVAHGADELAKTVLHDLINHGRSSGTDVGRYVKQATESLQTSVSQAAQQGAHTVADVGANVGKQFAQVASGILSGLAKGLDEATKERTKEKPKT